jgi:hypothetical protein
MQMLSPKFRLKAALLLVAAVFLSGTASAITPSGCDDLSAQPVRFGVGFDEIYNNIVAVRCANCHTNGGSSGGLALPNANTAFANLINILPTNSNAQDVVRVRPGNPAGSFFHLKVNCTTPGVGAGVRMPRNAAPLTLTEQALIFDWILQGANRDANADILFQGRFEDRF